MLCAKGDPLSADSADSKEVFHLRKYSNYLAPQLGALSADTWTLVATYLRNLLLNWMAFVPLLLAAILLPRLLLAILCHAGWGTNVGWFGLAEWRWLMLIGFAMAAITIVTTGNSLPSVRRIQSGALGSAFFLWWTLLPL